MTDSRLSVRYAFLYFLVGAWAFAVLGIAVGCVTGGMDTGPKNAELWRKALYVSLVASAAALPAAALGALYAAWLRIRRFSASWRNARIVPLSAGFFSWILVVTFYFPIYLALGQPTKPTEPTGSFLADYSYLAVIPLVPLALAEASIRLLKSIDSDIPALAQRVEDSETTQESS